MKFNIKNRKTAIIIAVVGVLSIGGFLIFKSNSPAGDELQQEQSNVEIYTIPAPENVFINGKIAPKKSKSFIADSALGELNNINVSNGEYVDKGDTLYTYKNKEKESEVKLDEDNLKSMNSDLSEFKKNPTENLADIKMLEREIKSLKSKISNNKSEINTSIKAPFSGVIYLSKNTEEDSATNPILTLQSKDYFISGSVTERDLLKLKTGMDATIHVFSTGEDRPGTVSEISKMPIDASSGGDSGGTPSNLSKYPVSLEFTSNDGLVNGFNVQAKIIVSEVKMEIPSSAILLEGDNQYVLIDESGTAVKKLVTTEPTSNSDMTVILSGVEPGQSIVQDVNGSGVKDGDSIYPSFESPIGQPMNSSGGVSIG